jgi:biopolymer transport protein ExbD
MAEMMNMPAHGGRRKVQAPRIDLTPMVDLGFLLITFFMFTTTLAQEKALVLNMPSKEPTEVPTAFPEESTLTVIPAGGHKVYYYEGAFKGAATIKQGSIGKVTGIVTEKSRRVAALPASYSAQAHRLHVLIKATEDSHYDDLVKAIDAMLIANVQYYAITDITPEEVSAVAEAGK